MKNPSSTVCNLCGIDKLLKLCQFPPLKKCTTRNSLAVQCLGLRAFTAEGAGSIPGGETKTPQALQLGQKKKKKHYKTYLIAVFGRIKSGYEVKCDKCHGRQIKERLHLVLKVQKYQKILFLTKEGDRRWFFQDTYDFKKIQLKRYKKIKEKFKKYIHMFKTLATAFLMYITYQ